MNLLQAQLSALVARFAAAAAGHLPAIAAAFAAAVLVLIWVSRRGDPRADHDDAPALQPAALAPARPSPPADTRRALLVVDDSAVARAKLLRLFDGAGYRVTLARDGVEALQLLTSDFFSVLVTDLEMPNLDGLELIATVQGSLETEDLPIIAITGHDALQARVGDYRGLFGIFRKPWNDRELLKRVEALAGLRTAPPPAPTSPSLRRTTA